MVVDCKFLHPSFHPLKAGRRLGKLLSRINCTIVSITSRRVGDQAMQDVDDEYVQVSIPSRRVGDPTTTKRRKR